MRSNSQVGINISPEKQFASNPSSLASTHQLERKSTLSKEKSSRGPKSNIRFANEPQDEYLTSPKGEIELYNFT